jgi:hypothetical protein
MFLAGSVADGFDLPKDLSDFLTDNTEKEIQQVIEGFPSGLLEEGAADLSQAAEWFLSYGRLGYLVNVATPVMRPVADGVRSYSWRRYRTRWLYGETMENVVQKALDWAAACRVDEDASAKGGA